MVMHLDSRAGRSVEDRLLGMEEARGSNPRQSMNTIPGFVGFRHKNKSYKNKYPSILNNE